MPNLTLEEIAHRAGVSRSTVSRVINNKSGVRPNVRQRVLEIVEQTGFQPHAAARSLASQRSHIIGLVIPRSVHTLFTDPYFPRLTMGISQACNQHDYALSLFLLHTGDEEKTLYPRITRRGLIDGVIVQAGQIGEKLISRLARSDVPFVVAGRPVDVPEASYVDIDNVAGARSAVSYLIRLGYTRVGTITGPLNTTVGLDRLEGYRIALDEKGLALDERLLVEGDFTESGGYLAAQRLLEHKPEAIFAASDMMALGALRAIREANLSVPQDIAVVGYDDLPPATLSDPPLTTVRQPIHHMGIELVETLLDIIENRNQRPQRKIFETELVIRESCGSKISALNSFHDRR